jgi:hypothetical protein
MQTVHPLPFKCLQSSHHQQQPTVCIVVNLKSTVFWDITPRSPLSVNRRFTEKYHLHFQGRKNKFSVLAGLVFNREDGGDVPPKRRLILNGLQGVLSQKTVLFITTGVWTLIPTVVNLFTDWALGTGSAILQLLPTAENRWQHNETDYTVLATRSP